MTSHDATTKALNRATDKNQILHGRMLDAAADALNANRRIVALELMVIELAARAGVTGPALKAMAVLGDPPLTVDDAALDEMLRATGQARAWERLCEAYERDTGEGE
jgi:hypothetical protein